MAKKNNYINNVYQGGYSSLTPSYGDVFTGYRVSAGSLGLTTDPRTANILQEASTKLSTGVKQIELSAVSPEIFESIPQQHLKEINRLSKLTGIDVSVHAPVVEPSGISRQGFSEEERKRIERQMLSAVERSHEINPKGNVPVTFHSSAIIPQPVTEKGEKFPQEAFVIDSEEGSIGRIPIKERKFPGEQFVDIKKEIDEINKTQWSDRIRSLLYYTSIGEKEIKESEILARAAEAERKAGKEITEKEKEAEITLDRGRTFLDNSYRQFKNLFETAYKPGSERDKEILNELANKISSKVEQLEKVKDKYEYTRTEREIIDNGINTLKEITPQTLRPLDEFAKEKTARTFANVAFNSFKKFKDKAPIISIENPPAGGAFSTGEELKKIVEDSRNKLIERLIQEEKMDKKKAEETAKKIIGVTWDVGHINMLRRYGYSEKDIIKETEKVAPLVKHVHLSDNFGFEHTELPMGMGNVPIKEILEKLPEKDLKKVIEAANWWQHFKTPPVKETMEALGSPLYSMFMSPYWNQAPGFQQGYYGGMGATLPQINYETFGAGFSTLPLELGGQRPGAQGSRISGRPME